MKKNKVDKLFVNLNSCYGNVKLALEINPKKFLNTEIIHMYRRIKKQVYNKLKKLPVHASKIPFNNKRNAIMNEVNRAKRIVSEFDKK